MHYIQLSHWAIESILHKMNILTTERWKLIDNKDRIVLNRMRPKMQLFIKVCETVQDEQSTFPVSFDEFDIIGALLHDY
ncbi:hypothetical protein Aeh1ORF294c [Aeromonas phage Aeh1]|uniref:Uncharacterized protein n=1 Tax=Aeromonas phage Aeh1 TaxID=2880362 RepID=Q76YD2_9CAUD|nr:hypothetical protein Aeh1p313 [Aeromonas phage Aeh1]AAQ17963.1 hypothetical protein Aeh1ORF294c [Aeromonas phage Aeh1]